MCGERIPDDDRCQHPGSEASAVAVGPAFEQQDRSPGDRRDRREVEQQPDDAACRIRKRTDDDAQRARLRRIEKLHHRQVHVGETGDRLRELAVIVRVEASQPGPARRVHHPAVGVERPLASDARNTKRQQRADRRRRPARSPPAARYPPARGRRCRSLHAPRTMFSPSSMICASGRGAVSSPWYDVSNSRRCSGDECRSRRARIRVTAQMRPPIIFLRVERPRCRRGSRSTMRRSRQSLCPGGGRPTWTLLAALLLVVAARASSARRRPTGRRPARPGTTGARRLIDRRRWTRRRRSPTRRRELPPLVDAGPPPVRDSGVPPGGAGFDRPREPHAWYDAERAELPGRGPARSA